MQQELTQTPTPSWGQRCRQPRPYWKVGELRGAHGHTLLAAQGRAEHTGEEQRGKGDSQRLQVVQPIKAFRPQALDAVVVKVPADRTEVFTADQR